MVPPVFCYLIIHSFYLLKMFETTHICFLLFVGAGPGPPASRHCELVDTIQYLQVSENGHRISVKLILSIDKFLS